VPQVLHVLFEFAPMVADAVPAAQKVQFAMLVAPTITL
jgi:hypothetical protein